jgi:hypothetical protein
MRTYVDVEPLGGVELELVVANFDEVVTGISAGYQV